MSEALKTHPKTLPRTPSDFLKWEATNQTRAAVAAAPGTKAGTFVAYPARAGKKLLALTDEQDGKVIVQTHNCVIDLSLVDATAAKAGGSKSTIASLLEDGDVYGIVYKNVPVDPAAS